MVSSWYHQRLTGNQSRLMRVDLLLVAQVHSFQERETHTHICDIDELVINLITNKRE